MSVQYKNFMYLNDEKMYLIDEIHKFLQQNYKNDYFDDIFIDEVQV